MEEGRAVVSLELREEGRVLKLGRALVFCEADVRDGSGELVAQGVGTFRVKRRGEPPELTGK